ncbi:MAG: aminomethyl-transferring glycine dehydrogenase subunit GcvPB [Candidatus Hydrogenedentes bacterium]|nr:aminomethyl-transferring glycine dehydrogenase subunit GcvPB [Candidatus Hydrogenedentota bacterium]
MQLIFDKSRPGRRAITWDNLDVTEKTGLPAECLRMVPPALPELGELDVVRHFTRLSQRNVGIDDTFYPLGSCTMKYNPKIAEVAAAQPGFAGLHPHLSSSESYWETCQGALELVYELERLLAEIAGMEASSLQPIAGAHGELTGALLMAAYHRDRGHAHKDTIIVPDSAHGTNPASAVVAGFKVVEVPSDANGQINLDKFRAAMTDNVAGIMLTCPNTHGLFEEQVQEIAKAAHAVDALLYYDGANLNAIIGQCRPGDLGFDVMHYNLHKTFATPHGMGGPGCGPVGVAKRLVPYLPGPRVVKRDAGFALVIPEKSIGRVAAFFGNFLIAVRAYAYLRYYGDEGLKDISRVAVLNANYIHARLKEAFKPAFDGRFMHECLFSAVPQAEHGVHAMDIAKALLDYGFHAPTVYFPLTVKECLMIEPTETESKETLDQFCDAMLDIAERAIHDPEALQTAPTSTPVGRLDEVRAARELNCACL